MQPKESTILLTKAIQSAWPDDGEKGRYVILDHQRRRTWRGAAAACAAFENPIGTTEPVAAGSRRFLAGKGPVRPVPLSRNPNPSNREG